MNSAMAEMSSCSYEREPPSDTSWNDDLSLSISYPPDPTPDAPDP